MEEKQIEALEKIAALKEKGVLTDAEFEKQKQEILSDVLPASVSKTTSTERADRNIFQCYADCFIKYFQFSGRSSRYEYWSFYLVNLMISIVLSIPALAVLSVIYSFAALIPGLAVAVRRMHDINKSGWKLLLPIGLFLLTAIALATISAVISYSSGPVAIDENIKTVIFVGLGFFGVLGTVITYLYWMFKKGDPNANKYGPVPFVEEKRHRRVVEISAIIIILLPILGILSVGMIAGYSKANQKVRLNKTFDQIALVMANTHTLFSNQDSYKDVNIVLLENFGALPDDMIDESHDEIVNLYGGPVRAYGDDQTFTFVYDQIPVDDCFTLTAFQDSEYVASAECIKCNRETCTFKIVSY